MNKVTVMKLLIWGLTGVLALLWTGAAAMLSAAVNWLAVWMPPGFIEPLKASISELLGSVVTATSWIAPMLGWLSPLVWIVWGLVLALMLVLAGGAHLLVSRSKPRLAA